MRQLVTQEAARIMAEEGINDYLVAKRKAAERLGAPDTRNLPGNREIQDALIEYQRLFGGEERPALMQRLREAAVDAMQFLERFEPRLVGSVLHGTATEHSDVNLHLFAETPEEVVFFLMEHGIPHAVTERRFRFGREEQVSIPVYRLVAGDVAIDLAVFPRKGLREAPRSRIDGAPMERAGVAAVQELLPTAKR
ncbi:MAG TPA: hypothetical protein VFY81_00225 [Gammaproteobacteria bacterium]|nr:hypothetical protein [Gammaproteobacteria bacterium]